MDFILLRGHKDSAEISCIIKDVSFQVLISARRNWMMMQIMFNILAAKSNFRTPRK